MVLKKRPEFITVLVLYMVISKRPISSHQMLELSSILILSAEGRIVGSESESLDDLGIPGCETPVRGIWIFLTFEASTSSSPEGICEARFLVSSAECRRAFDFHS